VYFLVGEPNATGQQELYIGQTDALWDRLGQHQLKREFWTRALILVSLSNSLTKTHALYLERHCLRQAAAAGRYAVINLTEGNASFTPAPLEADCLEIFDTARILLTTLGHPIFEPLTRAAEGQLELFYCTSSGANGVGEYTPEGFVVLKGSKGRAQEVESFKNHTYASLRQGLKDSGVLKLEGDFYVFQVDHLFTSPSPAAAAVMGRASNGWTDWRTEDGKQSLGVVKRQLVSERAPSG
jgi:hypothetical protein